MRSAIEGAGSTLIIITNAPGIPVHAPLGYLADCCIGPLNCLIPCVALCGILIVAWATVHTVHTVTELYFFAVFMDWHRQQQ